MADETPAEAPETDAEAEKPEIPAEVKAALRKANKEAETLRHRLKEIEDAEKTEMQKLQDTLAERDQQLATLPATVRQQAIRFASEATRAGFLDPEDALTFLAADVDLGDDAAVKAALEDLAQRKPHLVRSDATPRVTTRPRPKGGAPAPSEVGSEASGKAKAALALRALSQK